MMAQTPTCRSCWRHFSHLLRKPPSSGSSKKGWCFDWKKVDVHRSLLSCWTCLGYAALGVSFVSIGSTILDLSEQLDVSVGILSSLFAARAIGSALGSGCTGVVFNKLPNWSYVFLTMVMVVYITMTSVIPLSVNVYMLVAVMLVSGLTSGAQHNGFNTVLIKLWKDNSGPWMQVLHFSYAFGGFVAPLIARHFISERPDTVNSTALANLSDSDVWSEDNSTGSGSWPTESIGQGSESLFRVVYWISSALYAPTLLAYAFYAVKYNILRYILKKKLHADGYIRTIVHIDAPEESWRSEEEVELLEMNGTVQIASEENAQVSENAHDSSHSDDGNSTTTKASIQEFASQSTTIDRQKQSRLFNLGIIILLAMFIFMYVGMEVSYGSWIFTVVVTGTLDFSKSRGAIIQSLYWGVFAFTRLFSVLLALLDVRSSAMLVGNLTGSLIAASIMVSFPHNAAAIWVGSAVLGMSYASVFPTTMTWMSETIDAPGIGTTVIVGAGSVGVLLTPAAMGGLISAVSPDALFYMTFVGIIISAALVVVLLLVAYMYRRKQASIARGASEGVMGHRGHGDQEEERLIDSEGESDEENTTQV